VGLVVGVFFMAVGLGCTLARVDFVATSKEVRARALEKTDIGSGDDSSSSSSASGQISIDSKNEFNPLRDLEVAIEMADALIAPDKQFGSRSRDDKS